MKVQGSTELIKRFGEIPPAVQTAILKRAIVPALTVMKLAAIANVTSLPSSSEESRGVRSALASKIKVIYSSRRGMSKGRLAVWGGMSASSRPKDLTSSSALATLSHILEFGFKSTYYYGMRIKPKLIQPRPFMKPAFDQTKHGVIPMIEEAISMELKKLGM